MDLTYLFAVVVFLGTGFELAAALTGRFIQRKAPRASKAADDISRMRREGAAVDRRIIRT